MAEPATSGQWLYFRVLAEPNPDRGGLRAWRLHELARRATQLSRREHTTSVVTGSLYTCLKKKGLVETYSNGRRCTLWRLTAKVRRRSRRREAHLAGRRWPADFGLLRASSRGWSTRRRRACCATLPPTYRPCRRRRAHRLNGGRTWTPWTTLCASTSLRSPLRRRRGRRSALDGAPRECLVHIACHEAFTHRSARARQLIRAPMRRRGASVARGALLRRPSALRCRSRAAAGPENAAH